MATRKTLSVRRRRNTSGFTGVLTSALLEWLLIFLLFVNALFSYLVTRLARFCELEAPCLLCSRLDRLFGNETPGFYLDLICGAHKLEISSLVFCHVHKKLADVHGMCEGCLRSFSTEKKSNSETYRLLVGTLGTDFECCDDRNPLLEDPVLGFSSKKICSCCNEPWTLRLDTNKMVQFKATGPEIAEHDIPLLATEEKKSLHLHDGLKCSEKISKEMALSKGGTSTSHPLSHIGYSELKIASDSESEVPFSDDDDRSSLVRGQNEPDEEIIAQNVPLDPHFINPEYFSKTLSDDLAPEELICQVPVSEPSLLVPQVQHDVGDSRDLASSTSAAVVEHGVEDLNSHQVEDLNSHQVEDLNSHQVEEKTDVGEVPLPPELIVPSPSNVVEVPSPPELISLNDVPPPSNVGEVPSPPELISLNDVPSPSNVGEVLLEELAGTSNVTGTDVLEQASVAGIQEICKLENNLITSTEPRMRTSQVFSDRGPPMTNLMDLSDAYELVIRNKVNQASNIPEQLTVKDSPRVSGDLKLWLSQISSARGVELSLSEISPRVYGQWEDLKFSDASSPIGLQILQKRISLERNMSGFESLDGSIVSEIEGENMVDRLKRQVEYDRKSMNALYKELEEERNASAIAANQALAMITRLQEEKAALQTEALQYLRMMEEQAEYDVDALQKANVLLAEKEKEVEVLEAELETYTEKFPTESTVEKTQEIILDSGGNMIVDHSDVFSIGYNINTPCNTPREHFEGRKKPDKIYIVNGNTSTLSTKNSLVGFEDERSYISQGLKKLEKKLQLFSNNGVHFPNDGYSGKAENGENYLSQLDCQEVTQGSSQCEEDGLLMKKYSSVCSPTRENFSSSIVDPQFVSNKECTSECEGKDQETHLVALEHEVSDLNERLKTLEADRSFLEHTINSLRTGDGIQFIQEIAHELGELRRNGIRREQALQ